jgi:NAD(P)-dependent dehydrogenase (short-subunit alcohol dehydrogenase family)
MRLDNTSAIVTGAASGLGAATAAALAEQGARVSGLDLDVTRAPGTKGVIYLAADVTSEEQVAAAVLDAAAQGPLRTVVNCAGIAPSARPPTPPQKAASSA